MVKVKSLNYPSLSLPEALLKIKLVYEQECNQAMDKESIALAMGYTGVDEASTNAISALNKYGLLTNISPSLFKVSEDAENIILLPKGHPDRIRALQNIAFSPYLFDKLHQAFGEQLPGDNILCSFMIKMGFSSKTIDNVIYAYQETLKFIKEEEASVLVELKGSKSLQKGVGPTCFIEDNNCSNLINVNITRPPSLEPLGEMLSYRIAADCSARIQFDGPVTQEAIKKLVALLELNADVFPKKLGEISNWTLDKWS